MAARGVDNLNRGRNPKEAVSVEINAAAPELKEHLSELQATAPVEVSDGGGGDEHKKHNFIGHLIEYCKQLFNMDDYWSFSHDEIIQHEFKQQIESILHVTGGEKVSLVAYSNGALIALGSCALEPTFGQKIDTLVLLGPTVYTNKFNLVMSTANALLNFRSDSSSLLTEGGDAIARDKLRYLCTAKAMRYSVCRFLIESLYGKSEASEAYLDQINLLNFIGKPQSKKGLVQTVQIAHSGQFRWFSYGLIGNFLKYKTLQPPDYNLAEVRVPRIYLISGDKDALADRGSMEFLVSHLNVAPLDHQQIQAYNHLDLIAGLNVEQQVNKHVLFWLDDRYLQVHYYAGDKNNGGQPPLHAPKDKQAQIEQSLEQRPIGAGGPIGQVHEHGTGPAEHSNGALVDTVAAAASSSAAGGSNEQLAGSRPSGSLASSAAAAAAVEGSQRPQESVAAAGAQAQAQAQAQAVAGAGGDGQDRGKAQPFGGESRGSDLSQLERTPVRTNANNIQGGHVIPSAPLIAVIPLQQHHFRPHLAGSLPPAPVRIVDTPRSNIGAASAAINDNVGRGNFDAKSAPQQQQQTSTASGATSGGGGSSFGVPVDIEMASPEGGRNTHDNEHTFSDDQFNFDDGDDGSGAFNEAFQSGMRSLGSVGDANRTTSNKQHRQVAASNNQRSLVDVNVHVTESKTLPSGEVETNESSAQKSANIRPGALVRDDQRHATRVTRQMNGTLQEPAKATN